MEKLIIVYGEALQSSPVTGNAYSSALKLVVLYGLKFISRRYPHPFPTKIRFKLQNHSETTFTNFPPLKLTFSPFIYFFNGSCKFSYSQIWKIDIKLKIQIFFPIKKNQLTSENVKKIVVSLILSQMHQNNLYILKRFNILEKCRWFILPR